LIYERTINDFCAGWGDVERLDQGALAQKIDKALRPLQTQFKLALTSKIVVEDDLLGASFEDQSGAEEVPFSFDGTIEPD
jgi:hypothetical protein